jgi:hypothetical protein
MGKLLPGVLIATAAVFLLTNLKAFKRGVRARISQVKLNLTESKRTAFTRLVLDVVIAVENPSKVQLRLTGGKLNFLFNNKLVGVVDRIGETYLTANATVFIPVKVQIDTFSFVGSISQIIKLIGTGISQKLTVNGDLTTNVGSVNVNETITFQV